LSTEKSDCRISSGLHILSKTGTRAIPGSGEIGFFYESHIKAVMSLQSEESAIIIENIAHPILVINPDRSIRYANRATQELTGFGLPEILEKKPPYPWWDPDDKEQTLAQFNESLKQERHRTEGRFRNADGEEFWVQQSFVKVRKNGRLSCYLLAWSDVTLNARSRIGTYDKGIDHRLLFDNLPHMAFIKDKSSHYIYCNKTFATSAGMTPQDVVGKRDYDIFPRRLALKYRKDDSQVLRSGRLLEIAEPVNFPKTGQEGFVRIIKAPVRDDDGNVIGVLGFAWDITFQQNLLETLRDSAEFNSSMLNNAPNPVLVINPDRSVRYVNRATQELTGLGLPDILGKKPPYPWWNPQDEEQTLAQFNESLEQEKHITEGHFRNAGGNEFWVQQSFVKVRKSRKLSYYLVNWVDITESKSILNKLKTNEDKLRRYALQLSLTEEKEKRRIATALHDAIGHELSFCKFKIDKATRSMSQSEVRQDLVDASVSINKAIESTKKLTFEISPPVLWELGLHTALLWLCDNMEKNYGIRTRVVHDGKADDFSADLNLVLFQAARELLVNVAKHSKANHCEISLTSTDDNIIMSVKDDGVGFQHKVKGTLAGMYAGIGLFSIHERVSSMKGSINVESKPGLGARIKVTLPLEREKTV
jgi:PAS domain S-box-containing protein